MPAPQASPVGGNSMVSAVASLRQPRFVVCVAALTLFIVGFYGATWNMRLRKLPAPLRVPLANMDKAALDPPYKLEEPLEITPEMLDWLGTTQYMHWILSDRDEPDDSPVKRISLFITFYTGQPDPVPHVPDACYVGAGFMQSASRDWSFDVPELGRQIPVRLLQLELQGGGELRTASDRRIVTYFFGVNGGFAADRNAVRAIVGKPWEAYAYYSKVEAGFSGLMGAPPTLEQAQAAAEKLYRKLVPILVSRHWPDWKALHEKPAPSGPEGRTTTHGQATE